ncbi:MAG: sulfite exporter TauE/SafE family protein [Flavobacteriales bacterium]
MEQYFTAFAIGLIGSLHCIGMCGPIALALPLGNKSILAKTTNGLIYNGGRILTYCLLGIFFGFFGEQLAVASTQQFISIAIGSIFILSVFIPKYLINAINPTGLISKYIATVKSNLSKFLQNQSLTGKLAVGLLNGFLPCGLVYAAIAGSIATGNLLEGMWFMFWFGLGTLPMMFTVYFLSSSVSLNLRNTIKKLVPVFLILLGSLFILRGLNLGIPYLSPKINVARPFVQDCD